MQEKIFDMLFNEEDVTWRNIIFEAVKKEDMNPWDVDISALAKRFLEMVKQLKEMDFKISGKIILAAAILLRLKSNKLLTDDLGELDRLIAMSEQSEEEFYEELESEEYAEKNRLLSDEDKYKLIPRTPQPRKRKVSIYDLVDALEKALEVKERRIIKRMPTLEIEIPKKRVDVSILMQHLFEKIEHLFSQNKKKVFFEDLLPGQEKEDLVTTFIPLLHLDNLRKIDIEQKESFGAIEIQLNTNSDIQKEIRKELAQESVS